MNFKTFNQWKHDLYAPPQVAENGDITSDDRVQKFELSYTDTADVKKEEILAITLAEAIYSALYQVIISKIPIGSEITTADTPNKYNEIKERLINSLSFYGYKIKDIGDTFVSFEIGNSVYTLSSDTYNFKGVTEIVIDDDMVTVWEQNDNATETICYLAYNLAGISVNPAGIRKINNLQQIDGLVKNYLFTHRNFLCVQMGFASLSEEDEYSYEFAKMLSYRRAIIDKLNLDRKTISAQMPNLREDLSTLLSAINRYRKMLKKIRKRIEDVGKSMRQMISDRYDSE